MVRWPGEWGVHDYEVAAFWRKFQDLPHFLRSAALDADGSRCAKQWLYLVILRQQVQRSERVVVRGLPSVWQGVEAGTLERALWMRGGYHGRGKVDGGRHDVHANQGMFHHVRMQRLAVSSRLLVHLSDALVRRGKQGACAAGKVGYGEFPDPFGIAPVLEIRYGEGRQEGGGRWTGVEGGQELPIRNESLEDRAGEIVGARHALRYQIEGGTAQAIQDSDCPRCWNGDDDFPRDVEYWPVVDIEDLLPFVRDVRGYQVVCVVAEACGAADAERSRKVFLKHECVRHDGHGHSTSLEAVLLLQRVGDVRPGIGSKLYRLAEDVGCGTDAGFQVANCSLHCAFWNCGLVDDIGERAHSAGQPP